MEEIVPKLCNCSEHNKDSFMSVVSNSNKQTSMASSTDKRTNVRNDISLCHCDQSFAATSYQRTCLVVIFGLFTTVTSVQASTTESANNTLTITQAEDYAPKAVITVAALVVFFIISLSVAKLFEYFNDRRALRDDASDISEYTKEILKAQMMMMIFNRGRQKGKKLKPEDAAIKYAKVWRAKLARNKARRMKSEKEATKTVEAISSEKTQKKREKTILSTVNEVDKLPVGATAKTTNVSKQNNSGSNKKGSSRPISAGLSTRPSSSKSTRPKSGFKSFGRFMVKKN